MVGKRGEQSKEPDVLKSDFGVRLVGDAVSREKPAVNSYHVQPNNPELHRRFIASLKRVMSIPDSEER